MAQRASRDNNVNRSVTKKKRREKEKSGDCEGYIFHLCT